MIDPGLRAELEGIVGPEHVLGPGAGYDHDATITRGLRAEPDATVRPADTAQVAATLRACWAARAPVVPRGGGTGLSGGAVAVGGGVVLSLERMTRVRSFDPLLWRMEVEAGMSTGDVQRLARENGLYFPPDPGAPEQSQIGGNVATNAGGPHAFKYGTIGAWVMGVEAVLPPGRVVRFGGPVRKDVSGYDVTNLLVGSEGTLGVITSVWLRLTPRPETVLPVVALYPDDRAGAQAVQRVVGSGIVPAALDYLDAATMVAAGPAMPVPDARGFAIVAELDGSSEEVERVRPELLAALEPGAGGVHTPDPVALWRWREGISLAVESVRGGKLSEDIVVPLEHLADAIADILAVGDRHGLSACSWGHAGDGNLHATFMIDHADAAEVARAEAAAVDVFALADRYGGSISGEHGIGLLKRDHLAQRWSADELEVQRSIKRLFDPENLMNPGKKIVV